MLGDIFDISQKKLDLEELNLEMSIPSFWDNQVKAIQKSKEQESLNSEISKLENIKDSIELLMSEDDEHQDILDEVIKELNEIEFQKMFSSETDFLNCYIDIQAGSGGTESNSLPESYGKASGCLHFSWQPPRASPSAKHTPRQAPKPQPGGRKGFP